MGKLKEVWVNCSKACALPLVLSFSNWSAAVGGLFGLCACKLYNAYRIVALYREPFDVFRFASTSTYRLFHHESARTPRGQKVKVNKTKQTPSLSGTFEHLPLCDMYGDVHHHVICVETFTSV